jgi:hypothetical protein
VESRKWKVERGQRERVGLSINSTWKSIHFDLSGETIAGLLFLYKDITPITAWLVAIHAFGVGGLLGCQNDVAIQRKAS